MNTLLVQRGIDRSIAVIPARAGSKRIPGKNVRLFHGKPMIAYAIDVARESGLFSRTIVSTEDRTIATLAEECGAEVPFLRPTELADDHTTTVEVIQHVAQRLMGANDPPASICCIYPCVPGLRTEDLRSAYELLGASGAKYVYPVARFGRSPLRALEKVPSGRLVPLFPEFEQSRTQDLREFYFDLGQFYFGTAGAWVDGLGIHSNGQGIELDNDRLIDIDTPDDWELAERALSGS